jgi:peptidoglycan-associated lipoprotein
MREPIVRICRLTFGLGIAAILLTGCPKTPALVSDGGTGATSKPASQPTAARPPAAPAPASKGYVDTQALADVHFDLDRAAIRPVDHSTLDANAAWLRGNGRAHLLLEGHADDRGTAAHNQALGERRAAAVRSALVARGVEPSRIAIRTYGEARPLCADSTDSCWARNRRVHFLVKE